MKQRALLIAWLIFTTITAAFSQETNPKDTVVKYYSKEHYLIEGTRFRADEKENVFDRLPTEYKSKVRPEVWSLSKNSAGISVRFFSNSPFIKVKWEVLNNYSMNHMPETGVKGVDLYCKQNQNWQYLGTGRPKGKLNEALIIENMSKEWREFKIFPDGLKPVFARLVWEASWSARMCWSSSNTKSLLKKPGKC